jgi:hypothetical protein
MYPIIKYIFAGVITFLLIALVGKVMPNLEITEELAVFMAVSLYLNFVNLLNYNDLKDTVRINQFLNTRLNVALHGEERCLKAVEKANKEYLESIEEDA